MKVGLVLLASVAFMGCGVSRSSTPAPTSAVAVAEPAASAAPANAAPPPVQSAFPDDAYGTYRAEHSKLAALLPIDGQPFLLLGGSAMRVNPKPSDAGFDLGLPVRPSDSEADHQEQLPELVSLRAPSGGDTRWKLDYDGGLTQWRDAWATRLSKRHETRTLVRVDDHESMARQEIRGYARLLRDRPKPALDQIVSSMDPSQLKRRGGPLGEAAEQLAAILDGLRENVTPAELPRFNGYARALHAAVTNQAAMWPQSDDAFLLELARRHWPARDNVVIRDGSWFVGNMLDKATPAACSCGVLIPDSTENNGQPLHAFQAPAAGKLGLYLYLGLALKSGPPGSCDRRLEPRSTYAIQHGVMFARLIVDADAKILGAIMPGYMTSAIYIAADASVDQVETMLESESEEISRQAE